MKKLTKAQTEILEGLYKMYYSKDDGLVVVGDTKKTKIKDQGLMTVLSSAGKREHDKFLDGAHTLAKKLGVKVEIKTIIKLI